MERKRERLAREKETSEKKKKLEVKKTFVLYFLEKDGR